jgi:hypothetical protein
MKLNMAMKLNMETLGVEDLEMHERYTPVDRVYEIHPALEKAVKGGHLTRGEIKEAKTLAEALEKLDPKEHAAQTKEDPELAKQLASKPKPPERMVPRKQEEV